MSLTYAEARERAALIRDVHTVVRFDLTGVDDFGVTAVVRFACSEPGAASFLELHAAREIDATLHGRPAPYDGHRIQLVDLAAENVVEVSARLPYVSDGDGMTTMVDPADGERYVMALVAMDIAQKVLPCFDQPDIKSTFSVQVDAAPHVTVLANGTVIDGAPGGEGRWSFATTPPIPAYLFFVGAGAWTSVTWDEPYAGGILPFGWHARASQRAELERGAGALRDITSRCFQHYTTIFDEPYAFADYQQVFTPGLNWGAMEYPGCVAYHESLLPTGEPTAVQREAVASTIAHEMAHMWFGNLVTMRWWEDAWLNESFADFMGYEVADRAAGYASAWTAAATGRKPTAYRADRRRSTHRIAEDAERVVDVDTAYANFDMITYAKGNAVLRQLVVWLGEPAFLAGVNAHLSRHAFGNATLADFLDALDFVTDRDVRGWAQDWLRTTGFDRIVLTRDGDVPVLTREGFRPHRFTVTAYDDDLRPVGERLVDLGAEPLAIPEWAGRAVVPNSLDETYAQVVYDDSTWSTVTGRLSAVQRPLTRAVLWTNAVERAEAGTLPVADLVRLVVDHLTDERDPVVFEGVLDLVVRVVRRYAEPTAVPALLDGLAAVAGAGAASGVTDLELGAARVLAGLSRDRSLLGAWLAGDGPLPAPTAETRWAIVQRLAELGDDSHIDPEIARDHTAAADLSALTARAAVPTVEAKQDAWARLLGGALSNREFEAVAEGFWGWEAAALVAPYLDRFAAEAVALASRSGQSMGMVIGEAFPWLPLTAEQRQRLRDSVAATLEGPVPTVLARSLADDLDDLDRVLAATGAAE